MSSESRNTYLEQVVAQQQQLEHELRAGRAAGPAAAGPPPDLLPAAAASGPARKRRGYGRTRRGAVQDSGVQAGGAQAGGVPESAVDVRIAGFGPWKTVLVPPNAFVVHTRRGHAKPLHIGLGTSFRYRRRTDSFLVVPGAMQTILISAFSICRELQGVVVQAYVQWIIQDFATAYRKLDFSDPTDPVRLVNLQLKEQAEAAIKDKVATMRVQEILSDKQPIIEELTARLRAVAEGEGDGGEGLGLRIVTVQIKEAVVSSARLWENLQKPYRAERERLARLAELDAQEAISDRQMAAERTRTARQLADQRELDELRHRNEAAGFDREAQERVRRAGREQQDARAIAELHNETTLHSLRLERERQAEEHEVGRLRIESEYALRRLEHDAATAIARSEAQAEHDRELLGLERERVRGQIDNDQSPERVQAHLIDSLAEIAAKLPKPAEVRTVTIGGADRSSLGGLFAELTSVVAALRDTVRPPQEPAGRS